MEGETLIGRTSGFETEQKYNVHVARTPRELLMPRF